MFRLGQLRHLPLAIAQRTYGIRSSTRAVISRRHSTQDTSKIMPCQQPCCLAREADASFLSDLRLTDWQKGKFLLKRGLRSIRQGFKDTAFGLGRIFIEPLFIFPVMALVICSPELLIIWRQRMEEMKRLEKEERMAEIMAVVKGMKE